jgi:hypothetical protein
MLSYHWVPPRMPHRFSLKHWLHIISSVNAAQDRLSPLHQIPAGKSLVISSCTKSPALSAAQERTLQQKQARASGTIPARNLREKETEQRWIRQKRGDRRTPIFEICYKMHYLHRGVWQYVWVLHQQSPSVCVLDNLQKHSESNLSWY